MYSPEVNCTPSWNEACSRFVSYSLVSNTDRSRETFLRRSRTLRRQRHTASPEPHRTLANGPSGRRNSCYRNKSCLVFFGFCDDRSTAAQIEQHLQGLRSQPFTIVASVKINTQTHGIRQSPVNASQRQSTLWRQVKKQPTSEGDDGSRRTDK